METHWTGLRRSNGMDLTMEQEPQLAAAVTVLDVQMK